MPTVADRPSTARLGFRRLFAAVSGATLLLVLLAAAALPAHGQSIRASVDASASRIDYTGSAFLHDWTGTSRNVSGEMLIDLGTPAGSSVDVRAPVVSFDSGNNRRDGNMREVTEASTFPTVRFRTTDIRPNQWGQTQGGYSGRWTVTGALTFHGQTHPVTASVTVKVQDDVVRAQTQFPVSLTRFGIDRPSIAWVAPISDTIRVDAQIVARQSSPSPDTYVVVASDGGSTLRSESVRPILQASYAGGDPGFTAGYTEDAGDGSPAWMLSIHGTAGSGTDLSTTQQMDVVVGDDVFRPLRIETSTRATDAGGVEEVATGYFSRSIFEDIATAEQVNVRIGNASFSLAHPTRRDMRLILDRVPDASAPAGSGSESGSSP